MINSRALQDILRDIVAYYPSQNLTGKSILIYSPYSILFHYYAELKSYRAKTRQEEGDVVNAALAIALPR